MLYDLQCLPKTRGLSELLVGSAFITMTTLAIVIVAWQVRQTHAGRLLHLSAVDQRQLHPVRFLKALEGRTKAPVEIVVLADDSEAFQLALQFQSLLQIANWKLSGIRKVEQRGIVRLANLPTYGSEEDQLLGIAVAVVAESQEEFDVFRRSPSEHIFECLVGSHLRNFRKREYVRSEQRSPVWFRRQPGIGVTLIENSCEPSGSAPRCG
jgi:hypothetical protein